MSSYTLRETKTSKKETKDEEQSRLKSVSVKARTKASVLSRNYIYRERERESGWCEHRTVRDSERSLHAYRQAVA